VSPAQAEALRQSRILEMHLHIVRQGRAVQVKPTVVGFRPLPNATRHPPWDPESLIVDDLGVAPHRREWRDR
jgi:hypothetical protein